ncbi:hypothetical protein ACQYAD_00800 [Neobacillus sp. SM06]|uniref:hypothetical protein n=1 Tax=Neobacillus sp. SM06 TaxID=3422492 RepID=UPI003D2C6EBE
MSECKLDHSAEEVKAKFESQKAFLPQEMYGLFASFFEKEHSQTDLNHVFHLLKKYDLATEEEKKARDQQLSERLRQA